MTQLTKNCLQAVFFFVLSGLAHAADFALQNSRCNEHAKAAKSPSEQCGSTSSVLAPPLRTPAQLLAELESAVAEIGQEESEEAHARLWKFAKAPAVSHAMKLKNEASNALHTILQCVLLSKIDDFKKAYEALILCNARGTAWREYHAELFLSRVSSYRNLQSYSLRWNPQFDKLVEHFSNAPSAEGALKIKAFARVQYQEVMKLLEAYHGADEAYDEGSQNLMDELEAHKRTAQSTLKMFEKKAALAIGRGPFDTRQDVEAAAQRVIETFGSSSPAIVGRIRAIFSETPLSRWLRTIGTGR